LIFICDTLYIFFFYYEFYTVEKKGHQSQKQKGNNTNTNYNKQQQFSLRSKPYTLREDDIMGIIDLRAFNLSIEELAPFVSSWMAPFGVNMNKKKTEMMIMRYVLFLFHKQTKY